MTDNQSLAENLGAVRERPWTEDRRNDDGSTTITMKRACNDCGNLLGDVSDEEIIAGIEGGALPDVRTECPRCNTTGERPSPAEAEVTV